jgi:Membrane transporters of cations and cationic drugs
MTSTNTRLRLQCFAELLIAIASEQVGTSALKASEGFTQPLPAALAVLGYVLSFYFFGRSMRALPMGLAYALWSGLGMLIATGLGIALFGEAITLLSAVGLLMIITGVAVLSLAPEEK